MRHDARDAGFTRSQVLIVFDRLLMSAGYKLIEDSWNSHGRKTFAHNDKATREFLAGLAKVLRNAGWEPHPNKLRAFRHRAAQQVLEIEPGGADTSGHFLHHMKSE